MLVRLVCRGGAIIGLIWGKTVHCLVRPGQPGTLPPAGEYRVGAPVNDLIYGPVAVMAPANGPIVPGADVAEERTRRLPGPGAVNTLFNPTGGRVFNTPGGITQMTKQEMPSGSAAFVLTTRSIPGRNCLVVTSASSDLFAAIGAAGGAVITVS